MNITTLTGEGAGTPPGTTPTIELQVAGPRGAAGFMFWAPRDEALVWDVEHEVVSSRCLWVPERNAWWIASSYLETVVAIALRFFPAVFIRDAVAGDRWVRRDDPPAKARRFG